MSLLFGRHFRNARENANLKQVDVASRTTISNYNLSNWENGKSEPCLEDAITLADLYGVTLDELLGHKPTKIIAGHLTTTEREIILKVRKLNEAGKLKVISYLDDLLGNEKYKEKEIISA